MLALNNIASELMMSVEVHACTDVTGFGLLGHACEMIEGTDTGMVINSPVVPYFAETQQYAGRGLVPGGAYRNKEFRMNMVEIEKGVQDNISDILFDPQTSGGLLIAVPGDTAQAFLDKLHKAGIEAAVNIGEVVAEPKGKIIVR
jgi:selenide,water dikinase